MASLGFYGNAINDLFYLYDASFASSVLQQQTLK
jgi:hypothetical protein